MIPLDGRQLWCVTFGRKQYVLFVHDQDGRVEVVKATEPGLGGVFVPPPSMPGVNPDGTDAYSTEVARAYAQWVVSGEREPFGFEAADAEFPAMRSLTVSSPDLLRGLPKVPGLRPGARYLDPLLPWFAATEGPIALDLGGDHRDWRDHAWFDDQGPLSVVGTNDPGVLPVPGYSAVFEPLVSHLWRWASLDRQGLDLPDPVIVERVVPTSGVASRFGTGGWSRLRRVLTCQRCGEVLPVGRRRWCVSCADLAHPRGRRLPPGRVGRCGHRLSGRQREWCGDRCRKRFSRRRQEHDG